MAKKKTKTAAIREALQKSGSPKEVSEILQKQGYDVSAQYVSTIKAADKKRADAGLAKRGPGRPKVESKSQDLDSVADMLSVAIDLVLRSGGKAEATKLVSTAATIVDKAR